MKREGDRRCLQRRKRDCLLGGGGELCHDEKSGKRDDEQKRSRDETAD